MGNGWWQASDGKWYPPEQHPDAVVPAPESPTEATPATETPANATSSAPKADVDPTAVAPPATTPPTTPPAGAPASTSTTGGGRKKVVVGVLAVVALVAAGFAALTLFGDDNASAQVTLESLGSAGSDPFTASVAPAPSATLADFADSGAPGDTVETGEAPDSGGYRTASGTLPGVYGGSLDEKTCDVEQLSGFLTAEPDKASAWAGVLEIDVGDIPAYLDQLTPVNLGSDTRVLNHGFADGAPVPRESVLQRGTAVLADRNGVPRVDCYGGNPLTAPSVADNEDFVGDAWSAFDGATVLVIQPGTLTLDEFQLVDIATGELFTQPVGSTASDSGNDGGIGAATGDVVDDGPIDFDTSYDDTLADTRTEASYTLDAPDGAVMTLHVSNDAASNRAVYATLASEGENYAGFRVQPGAEETQTIVLDHQGGAPFELTFTEGPAAYTFEVGLEIQSDAGQDGDAGDDFGSAFEVTAGREVAGQLGGKDRTDHYTLEIQPGTEFTFTAAVPRESERAAYFTIAFEGGNLHGERVQPGSDLDYSVLLGDEDQGTFDIIVTEGPADYTFTADFVTSDEGGGPGDAPSTLAGARTIDPTVPVTGEVGTRDSGDFYLFDAPSGTLQVTATADPASEKAFGVTIQDASGSNIDFFRVQPGAEATETYEVDAGTTLRLIVTEGRANYTITLG